jgi:surface antigen
VAQRQVPAPAAKAAKQVQRVAAISPARSTEAVGRRGVRRASASAGISCVPYARQVTGMAISGNGWQWWDNAAGTYARGYRPEPGSVLAFRSSGRMRYGHVAVVSQVLGPRQVLINHANWAGPGIRRGSVMHGVSVIDVSPANNWTDVRVQVGHDAQNFGRNYPTYGFIYNRPAGSMMAQAGGQTVQFEEVAEAPEPAPRGAPRAGERSSRRAQAAPARRPRN